RVSQQRIGAVSIGAWGCRVYPAEPRPEAIPSDADFSRMVSRIESRHRARVMRRLAGATVTVDPTYQCYVTDWTITNGYCPDPRLKSLRTTTPLRQHDLPTDGRHLTPEVAFALTLRPWGSCGGPG